MSLHSLLPRLTLSRKIFLALATLLVVLLAIFTGFSIFGLQRDLGPYVAEIQIRRMDWLAEKLQTKYAADGGWGKLQGDRAAWRRLQMGGPGSFLEDRARDAARRLPPWYEAGPPGAFPGDPPPPPLRFAESEGLPRPWPDSIFERLGLIDATGAHVAGATAATASAARLPIHHAGHVVGYLVLAPVESLRSQPDRAFLARQSGFIALTGLAGLILALALSWWLSRRWFAPIDDLTQGAKSVANGRLDVRVSVRGSDELALLGRTFNSMAQRLDAIEASRREWLADVAHELRTPLAVMRAEIEALQDGVHTFDDKIALQLHRQVMRLGQLVDDLRNSMHDQGPPLTFAPVYPLALLTSAAAATRARFLQQRISLDTTGLAKPAFQPMVLGDARRLDQVFMNLLENTLAYTGAGGTLQLTAAVEGQPGEQRLLLRFDDSAPGPSAQDLPRLFDRLFRGEASRSRETGGSGLGLSICRTIVEEHGGTIEAASSPLGGLRISIFLPLAHKD